MIDPRTILLKAYRAAVDAARPDRVMPAAVSRVLRDTPRGRTVVVGGGKAGAGMAWALEQVWPGELSGVVVTRYGHALERPERIELLEASHPIPDANSLRAGERILEVVRDRSSDDLVIALLSGGGSALMVAPWGVTLTEKMSVSAQLLRSGADITEMNTVRKHLSKLKGGRLALAAAPAHVVSLIMSDVVGDDLSTIASGPSVPDPTTFQDALHVLERYAIDVPAARLHLERGVRGELPETPKPGDATFSRVENHLIVTNASSLEAARARLERDGFEARVLSDRVTGEARNAAREHARATFRLESSQAMLTGGETAVTVRGTGRGGRNLEFLLGLALELNGAEGVYAIACDTDGIDGVTNAAGAILTPDTLERATRLGLNARAMLENNDAYTFFERLGDLVVTGPTGTNVNDFRCVMRVNP